MIMYLIRYKYCFCVFSLFNQISIVYCVEIFFLLFIHDSFIWKLNPKFFFNIKEFSFKNFGLSVSVLNMKEQIFNLVVQFLAL